VLTVNSFPKIILSIRNLGGDLVDWLNLEWLKPVVETAGIQGVVVVMWAIMPILMIFLIAVVIRSNYKQNKAIIESNERNNEAMTRQIGNLADAINNLSERVLDPPMNLEDSVDYFYLVMHEHVGKKLNYLGDILRKNSINSRKEQIQKGIENRFKSITTREAAKLSRKRSVCGDMGKILQDNIDWDLFLNEVYDSFFADKGDVGDADHLKIQDIKTIMYGKVDQIVQIIEDNGAHN
jgi:hypothetical protein